MMCALPQMLNRGCLRERFAAQMPYNHLPWPLWSPASVPLTMWSSLALIHRDCQRREADAEAGVEKDETEEEVAEGQAAGDVAEGDGTELEDDEASSPRCPGPAQMFVT